MSLSWVNNCYRADKSEEEMMWGREANVYHINQGFPKSKSIIIGEEWLEIDTWIADSVYRLSICHRYDVNNKILYVNCNLESIDMGNKVANFEEILPVFLEKQGIVATTKEEVSNFVLEEFLKEWFKGNSASKFSMDNVGKLETVYQ